MGGKAAILLVLGFSAIFLMFGHRFNSVSGRTVDNVTDYYAHVQAYNISVTAANIAASKLYFDPGWDGTGYRNVKFGGGEFSIWVDTIATGNTAPIEITNPNTGQVRETMPNPSGARLKTVYVNSKYHINGMPPPFDGNYSDKEIIENETIIMLRPTSMAYYGNYYQTMSAFPATGDVFSGPFHVNARLKTYGSPTFTGRVTTRDGLTRLETPPFPDFQDEINHGIDVDPPFDTTNMRSVAQAGGTIFRDTTGNNRGIEVNIEFHKNGEVSYKQKIGSGSWSSTKRVPLATLAPNGAIFVEKGKVYVKGTLNGRANVIVTSKGSHGYGKIYQTDNLRYANREDPTHYPVADDMLGLVAEKDIILQYNNNTKHKDIYTDASMYSQNGKVGPDPHLLHNDGYLRDWKIFGGIAAMDVKATADYRRQWVDGEFIFAPYRGYRFVQEYNNDVNFNPPPAFPTSNKFQVVTWLERRIYKKNQDL